MGRLADGTQIVELQPTHPDASEDAPITFRFATAIPENPSTTDLRAGLTLSHELGAGTVDIPGQYLSGFAVDGPASLGLPGPDAVLNRVTISEVPETEGLPR